MGDDTSIRVSEELADELYQRKGRSNSYEDFIWELLRQADKADSGSEAEAGQEDRTEEGSRQRDDIRERMEKRLNEIHIKGRPNAVKATRRSALVYAWERLREEEQMRPRDLADDVIGEFFENPNLNYSVSASNHPGYQLLDNFLRDTMMELPGVHSTGRKWQFREQDDE